ncbi:MAG: Gfo/Idh/MocA family protein [Pyrinomonadaceae bacterium]
MNSTPKKTEKSSEINNKFSGAEYIRVGIVGAGLMGKWHARAAKKAGGKIVAVTDIDEKRAKILAAKYPSAQSFASAAKLLEQQSIDVLHICAPTDSHFEIAEIAINAAVNIFIEKPLAKSAAETIYLYDLARKNNVKVCPAHQFAFQRSVEKAKENLPRIGRIIHLRATICSAGGAGFSAEKLDEIAADILPHPLSLLQIFTNNLLITENFDSLQPQRGELRITGQTNEISMEIFISLNARPTRNSFQIFGERGTIHLDLFHDFAFVETGKVSKLRKILHPFDLSARNFSAAFFNLLRRAARFETAYPGLQNLVDRFYQSIRENTEPPVSAAQTINVAQIRDDIIYRAAEKFQARKSCE